MSLQIWLPLDGNLNNQGPLSCSATLGSGVSLDKDGKTGNCYYINNSSIELDPTSIKSLGWTSMSACGWFKIVAFRSSYDGFIMCTDGTGWPNARFGFSQNTGSNICIEGGGSYQNAFVANTGQWYHFALTFASRTLKFYVNGALVKTLSTSGDLNLSTINKFSIGTWNGSYNGNMKVNDVRIYNHELTEAEVRLAMSRDLFAHYPLNGMPGDSGTVEYDISGNHNDAILSNGKQSFVINTPVSKRYPNYYNFDNSHYIKNINFPYASNIWSVSIWYYANNLTSGYNCIFCLSSHDGGDTYKKVCASPNTSGNIWCKIENISISSGAPLILNNWTHLVLTSDGTTGKVYQNGELITSTALTSTITDATSLGIGCRQANADFTSIGVPWHGGLSDFRFYAKCLTASEVSELFNMGI